MLLCASRCGLVHVFSTNELRMIGRKNDQPARRAELVHGHGFVEGLMFWRHKMWRPLMILHTPGLLSVRESPWQSIVLTNTSNDHCPCNLSFGSKSTIVSLCLTKEIEKRSWLLNSMKIQTHFRMECWPLWFFPYSLTLEFSHQIPSTVKLYSFQNCIYMQRQAFIFGRQNSPKF